MSSMWYTARRAFPNHGAAWESFLKFLGRRLQRVVTLDEGLWPSLYTPCTAEDWSKAINENFMIEFCTDQDHLRSATKLNPDRTILGVARNPESSMSNVMVNGFTFVGYDIVDKETSISALLNCGGFPEVFSIEELSEKSGLIEDFSRARQIRDELAEKFPDEPHAQCHFWAIWEESSV